ncbi:MAG: polyprenyl synthetase family protein [bacterium]|jgi:octaprenyl-diphosphate synthase|nr:polyprenyl synthetase family protein [bacterium]
MDLSDIYAPIKKGLAGVEGELAKQVRTDNEFVSQLGTYVLGGTGKRLRPALVLLSARSISENCQEQIVRLASVVELVHTATLVHDDVIDKAFVRRKQPSINRQWGNEISILFGDYLHSAALGVLSRLNIPAVMSRLYPVIKDMCEGEIKQFRMAFNPRLTEEEYFTIIRQKTGLLCQFSCESGALVAGGTSEQIRAFSDYGLGFGMAYQILDDCMDLLGNEIKAEKSLGSDLREGKLTLSLIHLLKSVDKKNKEKILVALKEENHRWIRAMLREQGSVCYALDKARSYFENGVKQLAGITESCYKECLTNLTTCCMDRVQTMTVR